MTKPLTAFALAACLIGMVSPVFAQDRAATLNDMFKEANNAFWSGDYEKAADLYAGIEELGVRAPGLSFNRATAEERLGNLGDAVLHYERVLRRDPGHEDTIYNLTIIRDYIARRANEDGRDADLAPHAGPWRAILDRFSPRSAAFAFLAFHMALFVILILRRFVRSEMTRLTLGVLIGVLVILTFATGAVAVGKYDQEVNLHEAIVTHGETLDVMEGPSSDIRRFILEEGSRVRVLETQDDWTKLRDDQGRDGWVRTKQLGEI